MTKKSMFATATPAPSPKGSAAAKAAPKAKANPKTPPKSKAAPASKAKAAPKAAPKAAAKEKNPVGRASQVAGKVIKLVTKKPDDANLRGGRLERFRYIVKFDGKTVADATADGTLNTSNVRCFEKKGLLELK